MRAPRKRIQIEGVNSLVRLRYAIEREMKMCPHVSPCGPCSELIEIRKRIDLVLASGND